MNEWKSGFLRLEKGRVDGYEYSQEIPLSTDITVVGRPPISTSPDADVPDIKVRDDYISRGHMRIYYSYEEKCFMVQERDIGTQNGTFINGDRIEPGRSYPLKDGCLLSMAKVGEDWRVIFRFREKETTLTGLEKSQKTPEEGLVVDLQARRVWAGGKEIPLRRKEFDLLAFLYENRGKACSRDEIAQKVWAEESGIVSEETIDTNIHRIRERIEADPSDPHYIITLPRYGFRLDL